MTDDNGWEWVLSHYDDAAANAQKYSTEFQDTAPRYAFVRKIHQELNTHRLLPYVSAGVSHDHLVLEVKTPSLDLAHEVWLSVGFVPHAAILEVTTRSGVPDHDYESTKENIPYNVLLDVLVKRIQTLVKLSQ